jgi:hypothetical protein
MKRFALVLGSVLAAAASPLAALAAKCGNVTTSINFGCSGGHGVIIDFFLSIVRFLGVMVGLVVILMIIIGGIQYITSNGDPNGVKAAKGRITGAITALVLYLLMFGILHYLIPGTF